MCVFALSSTAWPMLEARSNTWACAKRRKSCRANNFMWIVFTFFRATNFHRLENYTICSYTTQLSSLKASHKLCCNEMESRPMGSVEGRSKQKMDFVGFVNYSTQIASPTLHPSPLHERINFINLIFYWAALSLSQASSYRVQIHSEEPLSCRKCTRERRWKSI